MTRRNYATGTYLVQSAPWGFYHGGRAICADGRVRALKRIATTADTFYSVPAAVKVRGRTVSGYVMVETREGNSTWSAADPPIVKFVANAFGRNSLALPGGAWRGTAAYGPPQGLAHPLNCAHCAAGEHFGHAYETAAT